MFKNNKYQTTEQLYEGVLKSFEKDRLNLDLLRDMSHFFWGFFETEEQRVKYASHVQIWLSMANESLKQYWGPSASVELDCKNKKFICRHVDGREVLV